MGADTGDVGADAGPGVAHGPGRVRRDGPGSYVGTGTDRRGGRVEGLSGASGVVTLPSSRETLSGLTSSVLSLATGYLVLFMSALGAWLGAVLLAGGVAFFVFGVRAGVRLQRHYDEGGRVPAGSRALMWVLGMVAGVGVLCAGLLTISALVPSFG